MGSYTSHAQTRRYYFPIIMSFSSGPSVRICPHGSRLAQVRRILEAVTRKSFQHSSVIIASGCWTIMGQKGGSCSHGMIVLVKLGKLDYASSIAQIK